MKILVLLLVALLLTGCTQQSIEISEPAVETTLPVTEAEPAADPEQKPKAGSLPIPDSRILVAVEDYLPTVPVELKYATSDNFTGQVIYSFDECYLRYGTVAKLAAVQADLLELGFSLKIWDAFRPVSAQYRLWEVCPDRRYVADPRIGFSDHSRGNTVDVTLVDAQGREVAMPTGFDDFTALADRDYSDCPADAASNAQILEILMEKHGFSGYKGEWWHFSDIDEYPVEKTFEP